MQYNVIASIECIWENPDFKLYNGATESFSQVCISFWIQLQCTWDMSNIFQ